GGRPRGTRAAHPPRRRVLGRHETARSPGARRRRAAPAPDDRGRKPVRRRYRENAARGLDRELLRGAWPHARHPVARLWRRRAPGSPATRATGGRGGEPRSGSRRGRRARPGRSGTRPGRRLPAPGCWAGPEHRGRERGERRGIALAITSGAVARGARCPGPGGSDRRDPEKRVGGRGERPGRGACSGGERGAGGLVRAATGGDYVVVTEKDAVKLRRQWPGSAAEPLVAVLAVHWERNGRALEQAVDAVLASARRP